MAFLPIATLTSNGGKLNLPEPEGHVDLLVDDVEGQHAERVVGLDGARHAKLLEDALGDLQNRLNNKFLKRKK